MEVRDLLLSPPATRPYATLRDTLIRRTSDSDSSKLQQLLSTAELGDRKPSQLLRDMERLVGGRTIDPGMFRQLFLQRLPKNVVMVLEATSASVDLATQAEIADKLMELNGPPSFGRTVSAVQAPPESSVSADVAALRAEVAALTETIAHWQPSVVDRGPAIPVLTSHAAGALRATVGSRQVAPCTMTVCAITTDVLEVQHGSALHLVRTQPPDPPHQPPNLRETPRPGTNGNPPSWLSPFEWSPFVCHRPTDRSSLPGRHRRRGKRSPHFPSRPHSAPLPLLPTPHCCQWFINNDLRTALYEH